jgi:thioredoxin reductase
METQLYDVIIIGGSNAGLSAAMSLGRSLRKVLVIDSGLPCNIQTPHSHNFLTQDGNTPAEIAALAKQQVANYDTVQFFNGLAIKAEKVADGFLIETGTGIKFQSRKLILATGIKDIMPEIEGFSQSWGISVIHCPYCHGYEFRGQKTGLFANGDRAIHLSKLIFNLSRQLTIFTNGKAEFTTEQFAAFAKHGISVVETTLKAIDHHEGYINHVVLSDGKIQELDALYAAIPFVQNSDIPLNLGCEIIETGHIKVDAMQKTTISGIYACGDNSSGMRSVALSVATGSMAGAIANMELAHDDFTI